MHEYFFLIPALPLLGFLILSLWGTRLNRKAIAWIGAGTVSAAAVMSILICANFIQNPPQSDHYAQLLWNWFRVDNLKVAIRFSVDALSLAFVFVITFVGALIHIYSTAFMQKDRDYARFFAYMNLFVFSMLVLVMADNLVLLYLGWEGVGLCSYLLIGFWYETPANCRAANKAFYVTRIGDTAMAIALFLLFKELGSLHITAILDIAPDHFKTGDSIINLIALLLLAGSVGKSAQLPLQTWLPDAMAGPSPVSALIHAATMVTAGVYLIARMHTLFELSPLAMNIVAITGAFTLFIAACSAVVQTDIKRILAYSTISQIGYMFLALGIGAWSAAVFHFFTHAFFKALLFLAAGAVIEALHHEHNIFKMGGIRKELPTVFLTFLAGAASLAAVPLITAGFFSKDPIMWYAWSAEKGSPFLWLLAITGAFITAFYSTRLMLVVFWGKKQTPVGERPVKRITVPLIILAFAAVAGGFFEWPHNILHLSLFSGQIEQVLPAVVLQKNHPSEFVFQGIAVLVTGAGIFTAYILYYQNKTILEAWHQTASLQTLRKFLLSGWGFDYLYQVLIVQPFFFITRINKKDVFDRIYNGIARVNLQANRLLSLTQNGSLRWYIAGVLIGILFIITMQLI